MSHDWVDVHAHFRPPGSPEALNALWRAMRAEHFLIPEPEPWSARATLEHMDRAGIGMQLLSCVPSSVNTLRAANDFGAGVVADHPDRFGLLAALPTHEPEFALAELRRAERELSPDGFAVSTTYGGVALSHASLEPLWAELNARHSVVFVHPSLAVPSYLGLATPLVEVTFETARSVLGLLYAGVLRRYPDLTLVLAHCGGALPGLSGRVKLLGTQSWIANPQGITAAEIADELGRLYLDTAAAGTDANLAAALTMVPPEHLVYGSDCGAPCSTEASLAANVQALRTSKVLSPDQVERLGGRAFELFPAARRRHRAEPAGV